jgi:hypothetical protein
MPARRPYSIERYPQVSTCPTLMLMSSNKTAPGLKPVRLLVTVHLIGPAAKHRSRNFSSAPAIMKERRTNWSVRYEAHQFIAGDRFTAADVYVGSHVGWGSRPTDATPTRCVLCQPFDNA